MTSLHDELVEVAARTLGQSVAPFTLRRLYLRARVFDRARMTVEQVRGALPVLEDGLAEFLTPPELAATMQGFGEVLARWEDAEGGADGSGQPLSAAGRHHGSGEPGSAGVSRQLRARPAFGW